MSLPFIFGFSFNRLVSLVLGAMLSACRLAIGLLRVPRLFLSLLFFPLVIGLLLVYGQLLVTGMVLKLVAVDGDRMENHYEQRRQNDLGRKILLGTAEALPPIRVCRWKPHTDPQGTERELPPSDACAPDRLDIALRVSTPETFDTADYEKIFDGLTARLHVCRTCKPDAVVTINSDHIRSDAFSTQGLLLLRLSRNNDTVQRQFVAAMREMDRLRNLTGETYLHSEGLRAPVGIESLEKSLAIIVNIASLIIISLWLALKAHRRVLDYFARNGALLPMVASTGKSAFYGALWVLTFIRVGAFLLAAVPLTFMGISTFLENDELQSIFPVEPLEMLLWALALLSSLALATLIASISDLKQRHGLLTIMYRWVPLLLSSVGLALWSGSFLLDSQMFSTLRSIITATPVVGMGPILLSPALRPSLVVLAIHSSLTLVLLCFALRQNARWFAAHLEEL